MFDLDTIIEAAGHLTSFVFSAVNWIDTNENHVGFPAMRNNTPFAAGPVIGLIKHETGPRQCINYP